MSSMEHQWLFRHRDLTIGPVSSKQIIDKLYSGELSSATEVRMLDSETFMRVADIPGFRVHAAKAAAERHLNATAAEHQASQRKRLIIMTIVLAVVLITSGIAVAILGRYFAVHMPTQISLKELAWGYMNIDVQSITQAQRQVDEEFVDYTGKP